MKEYACNNLLCQLTGWHVRQCLEARERLTVTPEVAIDARPTGTPGAEKGSPE